MYLRLSVFKYLAHASIILYFCYCMHNVFRLTNQILHVKHGTLLSWKLTLWHRIRDRDFMEEVIGVCSWDSHLCYSEGGRVGLTDSNCHALTRKASTNPTGCSLELICSFRVVGLCSKVTGPLHLTIDQSLNISCPLTGAVTVDIEAVFYSGQSPGGTSAETWSTRTKLLMIQQEWMSPSWRQNLTVYYSFHYNSSLHPVPFIMLRSW